MSKVILFLTLFISPPAKPGQEVWSLQTTDKIEFADMQACVAFGKLVQQRFETTGTARLRGWCVDQTTGLSTNRVRPGVDAAETNRIENLYSKASRPEDNARISDEAVRQFCQDGIVCEIAVPTKRLR